MTWWICSRVFCTGCKACFYSSSSLFFLFFFDKSNKISIDQISVEEHKDQTKVLWGKPSERRALKSTMDVHFNSKQCQIRNRGEKWSCWSLEKKTAEQKIDINNQGLLIKKESNKSHEEVQLYWHQFLSFNNLSHVNRVMMLMKVQFFFY